MGNQMTKDDIISMAREAGIECLMVRPEDMVLRRFAALVAEKEREECAKVCDEDLKKWKGQADVQEVAAAIRARGQQ